jgi:biopolymer transport protein ExbB/TolQ
MTLFSRFLNRLSVSPYVWGAACTVAFYAGLDAFTGWLGPWLFKTLTERWESYACVGLFFIGMASLASHIIEVAWQRWRLNDPLELSAAGVEGQQPTASMALAALPSKPGYRHNRWRKGLQFVAQHGSTPALGDELRSLAAADAASVDEGYSLPRLMIWALPTLGCLGTVLGITRSISQLSASTSPELIDAVATGLSEAFGTTALALGLTMLLVLTRYFSERSEHRLLAGVRRQMEEEFLPQFAMADGGGRLHSSDNSQFTEVLSGLNQAMQSLSSQMSRSPQVGTASGALNEERLGQIVAEAITKAVSQREVSVGGAGAAQGPATGNWRPLQLALQQVAESLSRQQTRQENEGEAVQQLIDILAVERNERASGNRLRRSA